MYMLQSAVKIYSKEGLNPTGKILLANIKKGFNVDNQRLIMIYILSETEKILGM